VRFVVRNCTPAGYRVIEGDPKTAAGVRAVALDRHTVRVLREHRRRQLEHRRWPRLSPQGLTGHMLAGAAHRGSSPRRSSTAAG
jgi:hypothetical protein